MSDTLLDMKRAFETALSGATIRYVDKITQIAWPNKDFNPEGMQQWLQFHFNNVETFTDTKDATGMTDTGFAQIDVHIPLNEVRDGVVQYDDTLQEIAGDIRAAFLPNTRLSYGSINLTVTNVTMTAQQQSESWLMIPITINYTRI